MIVRSLKIITLAILTVGCTGLERLEDSPGKGSIVQVVDEPSGENCEAGGAKILNGVDTDLDGTLSAGEVIDAWFVCNDSDEAGMLFRLSTEPSGSNCEMGGMEIRMGQDLNSNSILDSVEVATLFFVCNSTGGKNILFSTTTEPPGANCESGGLKLSIGLDSDGNGSLGSSETSTFFYLCDGIPGALSMVKTSTESNGANCSYGGIKIETGLDKNSNNLLDSLEILTTGYLCSTPAYQTENVIILVVDGPRYSETWGDTTHQHIPKMAGELSKLGVVNTRFYNYGRTSTVPGYTSISTGCYQSNIDNTGLQSPRYPSVFQFWSKKYLKDSWIITSKDKLAVLANSEHPDWKDQYVPLYDCGISGLASGYRHDSITFSVLMKTLTEEHPQLVLAGFREPDFSGHKKDWNNYLRGIKDTDEYVYQVVKFIQSDAFYRDRTTVIVTNDHGRHLDNLRGGFKSHGDDCEGCRHVNFFAYGPDFKQNVIVWKDRELVDIPATVSELLHLDNTDTEGQVMWELFR